jgi:hypothetical protein
MTTANVFDIPILIDSSSLPFILKRLGEEKFERVTSLTEESRDKFRNILEQFYEGNSAMTQQLSECFRRYGHPKTTSA